jgi:hypothetical protein
MDEVLFAAADSQQRYREPAEFTSGDHAGPPKKVKLE